MVKVRDGDVMLDLQIMNFFPEVHASRSPRLSPSVGDFSSCDREFLLLPLITILYTILQIVYIYCIWENYMYISNNFVLIYTNYILAM